MTVQDVLDLYIAEDNYVENSMINKSSNDEGCTYKWLFKNTSGSGFRREIFISIEEAVSGETLEDRTVISYIEIFPAL